ncbi:unnamed protein product [Lampetra planeri]
MTSSFLNHFNNGDLRRAIDTPVLHHQQQQMSLKLTPENLRKGLAVMYAFGTWTLLGGMAFVYWGSNKDEPSALTPTYQAHERCRVAHGMLAALVLPVLVLGWTMADASGAKVDAAKKPWFCHDLDCPTFTLVAEHEGFQERAYEASQWVMTRVEGKAYERAVFDGFMRLFRYIGGYNKGVLSSVAAGLKPRTFATSGQTRRRSAPSVYLIAVVMRVRSVRCRRARAEHNLTVSFFVPPGSREPPAPSDPRVEFTSLPAMTAFVSSFDGYAMERDWLHQSQLLAKALDDAKLPYQLGSFHSAGYDPPFRPINRHNEVWIMKAE